MFITQVQRTSSRIAISGSSTISGCASNRRSPGRSASSGSTALRSAGETATGGPSPGTRAGRLVRRALRGAAVADFGRRPTTARLAAARSALRGQCPSIIRLIRSSSGRLRWRRSRQSFGGHDNERPHEKPYVFVICIYI